MKSAAIGIADADDVIEIEPLERGTVEGRNDGDLRLRVSVVDDTFAGSYDDVWVARDDWKAFLLSLSRLERERRGEAVLVSMSPKEFLLKLQVIDRAGHVAAHGFLSRYRIGRPPGNAGHSRVEYYLPVDPGLLRELTSAFHAFEQGER